VQPREFFLLISIFGKNVLVLKNKILGSTELQKAGIYMTGRPDCTGPSRREVKIDVWKYLQTIGMGLCAVSEQKLAHPDLVISPEIGMLGGCGFQGQVTAGDVPDTKGKMRAGYNNLRRKNKKQQRKSEP